MTQSLSPIHFALPPAEKHAFPFHIANLTCEIELAHEVLGPPPYKDFVDGLGDADYWAYCYSCGLRLLFEFIHPLGAGMQGQANVCFLDW